MSITVNSVPETWTRYSSAENKATYARPSHTSKVPRLVIFARRAPVRNGVDPGVLSMEVKIVNGDATDDVPNDRNTLIDITFRDPQNNASTVMDDAIDVLQALVGDTTLMGSIQTGLIPQTPEI